MLVTMGIIGGALFGMPGLVGVVLGAALAGVWVFGFEETRHAWARLKETPPRPAIDVQPAASAATLSTLTQPGGLQAVFDNIQLHPERYMTDIPVRQSLGEKLRHKIGF